MPIDETVEKVCQKVNNWWLSILSGRMSIINHLTNFLIMCVPTKMNGLSSHAEIYSGGNNWV